MAIDIVEVFGLTGRHALVTGAAHGIGRSIAQVLHAAGATVFAADYDRAAVEGLAEELGERVEALTFDQADPDSICALLQAVGGRTNRLDVLVNCAGIYPPAPFETVDVASVDRMFDVNLRGPFLVTQAAVPLMKALGGSIVNISSIGAVRCCLYDTVQYDASKAGVNGMTLSLALELAHYRIRVNAIMPGGVATERAAEVFATATNPPRGPYAEPGRLPLRNGPAETQDIAYACLYLASDASRQVTGQILAIDGGFLIS